MTVGSLPLRQSYAVPVLSSILILSKERPGPRPGPGQPTDLERAHVFSRIEISFPVPYRIPASLYEELGLPRRGALDGICCRPADLEVVRFPVGVFPRTRSDKFPLVGALDDGLTNFESLPYVVFWSRRLFSSYDSR